jgi:hypothetical protein
MHDRVSPLRPVPNPDTESVDITDDEPDAPDLASIVERAYLIAIGAASLAATAIVDAIARSIDPASPTDDDDRSKGLPVVAGAALGAAVQAGTLAVRAGVTAVRTTSGLASAAIGSLVGAERSRWLQDRLADLDDRGQRGRSEAEDAAASLTDVLVPAVVDAILDRVDLTALVAERLDLDAVVTQLNVDRVVDRVDLGRAIDRISIDEIAARLDVDAVAARIDVEAIVGRLDLVGIAQGVIDELDLPEMMREASGAMSAETVDGIRIRGMDADRLVTRLIDRVLSRKSDDVAAASPGGRGGDP